MSVPRGCGRIGGASGVVALAGCGRMLAPPGVSVPGDAATADASMALRRQRLVVRAIVDRHQVCVVGENAEPRRDPVLASGNTLAKGWILRQALTIAFVHAQASCRSLLDTAALPHTKTAAISRRARIPRSLKPRRRKKQLQGRGARKSSLRGRHRRDTPATRRQALQRCAGPRSRSPSPL